MCTLCRTGSITEEPHKTRNIQNRTKDFQLLLFKYQQKKKKLDMLVWTSLVWSGLVWCGLAWADPDRSGAVWSGLVRS